MRVVIAQPNETPSIQEIDGGLKSMQSIVGGYIEIVSIGNNVDLVVNEEGLLMSLPFNRKINGHYLVGPILAVSHNKSGATIGLSDKQIKFVMEVLG